MWKLAVVVALGSALALAPAAFGQGTPITGVCSFPITAEASETHGDMAHFLSTDKAPFVAAFTGQVFVTLTNLDNGKSITVNASGPALLQENSVLLLGQTLFLSSRTIGDIPAGLYLTSGPALVTFDEAGTTDIDLLSGVISGNLCDVLADP